MRLLTTKLNSMIDKRTGKERCEYLKQIRIRFAKEYNIPYEPTECTHIGECSGTCPQCEKELRELTSKINTMPDSENCSNLYFDINKGMFIINNHHG